MDSLCAKTKTKTNRSPFPFDMDNACDEQTRLSKLHYIKVLGYLSSGWKVRAKALGFILTLYHIGANRKYRVRHSLGCLKVTSDRLDQSLQLIQTEGVIVVKRNGVSLCSISSKSSIGGNKKGLFCSHLTIFQP